MFHKEAVQFGYTLAFEKRADDTPPRRLIYLLGAAAGSIPGAAVGYLTSEKDEEGRRKNVARNMWHHALYGAGLGLGSVAYKDRQWFKDLANQLAQKANATIHKLQDATDRWQEAVRRARADRIRKLRFSLEVGPEGLQLSAGRGPDFSITDLFPPEQYWPKRK